LQHHSDNKKVRPSPENMVTQYGCTSKLKQLFQDHSKSSLFGQVNLTVDIYIQNSLCTVHTMFEVNYFQSYKVFTE